MFKIDPGLKEESFIGLLFTEVQKYAQIGSGQGPSLVSWHPNGVYAQNQFVPFKFAQFRLRSLIAPTILKLQKSFIE